MKRFTRKTLIAQRLSLLLVVIALLSLSGIAQAQDTGELPTLVVVPGTIQSVLGCSGDWQPECEATALTYDEVGGIWMGTFTLPAGSYEYKVALNGTWDVNFGLNAEPGGANIPLELAEETVVTFAYSHDTNWVWDSVNNIIASVPGNYQSEIGCPGDWAPDCYLSVLQDPDGDGTYVFSSSGLLAGNYEAKVALNGSWAVNYGAEGARDGANIPFVVREDNQLVEFLFNTATNIMTIQIGGEAPPAIDIALSKAHWVTRDTIAWNITPEEGMAFRVFYSAVAGIEVAGPAMAGGSSVTLTVDEAGLSEEVLAKFPQLEGYTAIRFSEEDLDLIPGLLRSQIIISAEDADGALVDATGIQIPGVLDDMFAYDGDLGVTWDEDGVPTVRVWAPTAQRVDFHLFADSNPETRSTQTRMEFDRTTGVWSLTGEPAWYGQYYLFEVTVYAPSTQLVEQNLVTDPYSVSLSTNSQRSQLVDLNDPALAPAGWSDLVKPELDAPEDIVLYELHIRDFSIEDESVPPEHRGMYLAFTDVESAGMRHLRALAEAGLSHIHLLPAFDIATINEVAGERQEIDSRWLELFPPDSEDQQAIIEPLRDLDGFNWGYDPLHYTVPEGSYATDPSGTTRIVEFREMVQALNQNGLRVVMDVVYNHTNSAGQNPNSVLDRIVPGYYHRLGLSGRLETSTCCANTATEHDMMRRLMIDSVITWATQYKVDGFRFDLMGHHMVADMEAVRAALDSLTLEEDGVDGSAIYVYGEGWNFGEVADGARGVNATQLNLPGTGIGTFNDRIRDSVRGGNPFGDWQRQGFATGLLVDPNETEDRTEAEQLSLMLLFADRIRVGLAGNLADFSFTGASGDTVTGADVDYNGSPTGYTLDPQEHIVYISAHDNETIFDAIQLKAPTTTTAADRVRINNLALDFVMLSQGVPFFHAGDDILRSKSLDGNSYNSGDWYNALDWTYQSNNWGIGLPPSWTRGDNWGIYQPLLTNPNLTVGEEDILAANAHFREMLQIRFSSPLFRLQTADEIMTRLRFDNTGPDQIPGLIVMALNDSDAENLDPNYGFIMVFFNATPDEITFTREDLISYPFELHPVQAASSDPIVQGAAFDVDTGVFTIPARTTAVFVIPE